MIIQTGLGDFAVCRPVSPACAALLDPRVLIEMAAELDPDTYVPVLDLLYEDQADLEDDDVELQPIECWFEPLSVYPVPVFEQCPCCGNREHHGEFTL